MFDIWKYYFIDKVSGFKSKCNRFFGIIVRNARVALYYYDNKNKKAFCSTERNSLIKFYDFVIPFTHFLMSHIHLITSYYFNVKKKKTIITFLDIEEAFAKLQCSLISNHNSGNFSLILKTFKAKKRSEIS